jgi:hypothetical protein
VVACLWACLLAVPSLAVTIDMVTVGNLGNANDPATGGVYGGVVGYLDFSGNLDTAIAIRTMTVSPDGRASVQAGAGIVADSSPESEFEETLNKAKGLLVSLEMTAERLGSPQGRPPPR